MGMRSAGITAIALLSLGPAGAIVVDGPSLKDGADFPSVAAIARIHTPSGLIASGTLLPGGRYVLTAAHVVTDIPGDKISRGLVEFPSGAGRPRSCWKAVYCHPRAAGHRVWDAALIELSCPVGVNVIAGLPVATAPVSNDLLVHFGGYGHRGNGLQGDFQPAGVLTLGRNRFDQELTPELLLLLGLSRDCGPLLLHRFDPGGNEGHFAAGDSGGPGLVPDAEGRVHVVSIILGRHRGTSDSDHRLNGSFGELGLSLDVSALRPWLQPFLYPSPQVTTNVK